MSVITSSNKTVNLAPELVEEYKHVVAIPDYEKVIKLLVLYPELLKLEMDSKNSLLLKRAEENGEELSVEEVLKGIVDEIFNSIAQTEDTKNMAVVEQTLQLFVDALLQLWMRIGNHLSLEEFIKYLRQQKAKLQSKKFGQLDDYLENLLGDLAVEIGFYSSRNKEVDEDGIAAVMEAAAIKEAAELRTQQQEKAEELEKEAGLNSFFQQVHNGGASGGEAEADLAPENLDAQLEEFFASAKGQDMLKGAMDADGNLDMSKLDLGKVLAVANLKGLDGDVGIDGFADDENLGLSEADLKLLASNSKAVAKMLDKAQDAKDKAEHLYKQAVSEREHSSFVARFGSNSAIKQAIQNGPMEAQKRQADIQDTLQAKPSLTQEQVVQQEIADLKKQLAAKENELAKMSRGSEVASATTKTQTAQGVAAHSHGNQMSSTGTNMAQAVNQPKAKDSQANERPTTVLGTNNHVGKATDSANSIAKQQAKQHTNNAHTTQRETNGMQTRQEPMMKPNDSVYAAENYNKLTYAEKKDLELRRQQKLARIDQIYDNLTKTTNEVSEGLHQTFREVVSVISTDKILNNIAEANRQKEEEEKRAHMHRTAVHNEREIANDPSRPHEAKGRTLDSCM